MNETLTQCLKLSRGDYKSAVKLLKTENDNEDEDSYPNICFAVQQSIEKLMKAVLVLHQQEVPKTHDLGTLRDLISPWITLSISDINLVFLTDGAVRLRYPEDIPTQASAYLAV